MENTEELQGKQKGKELTEKEGPQGGDFIAVVLSKPTNHPNFEAAFRHIYKHVKEYGIAGQAQLAGCYIEHDKIRTGYLRALDKAIKDEILVKGELREEKK